MHKLAIFFVTAALAACSSPPEPPTVSGKDRKPISTAPAMPQIDTSTAKPASLNATLVEPPPPASITVEAFFPFNGTKFILEDAKRTTLLQALPTAKRIEVRGRTDGKHPQAGDEKVALNRALAAQRFLIAHGVPASKISVNYVSAGDYVADNFSSDGRKKNRRVEIEVFN